jgi:hypothetical protein
MPIFVGNSIVNTSIANSTITVDQTQSFAYATSNRNSIRPSLILDFARSQTVDPRITFTRASNSSYFNSLGVLSTALNNVPRIDYNPATGVCNGLLVEQFSVNLVLQSTFQSGWSGGNATLTANQLLSPDGTVNAAKFVESTAASAYHYTTQTITKAASALVYTFSVFLKASGNRQVTLRLSDGTNGAVVTCDPVAGTIATAGIYGTFASASGTMQTIGNGWYRFSLTTTSSTATTISPALETSNAGTNVYTGDGVSGFYCFGAQVEQLAFPTSYIPTTSASATRIVEVVSVNIQNYFNTTQGSIVMGFTQNYPTATGSFPWGLFSLQDAGASNSSRARIGGSGSTVINFDSYSASGTDSVQSTINSWTMGSLNKIGLSWSYASSSTYNKIYALNGVSGSSTPAITLPINNYILYIGAWNNATFPLTGWIPSIMYYRTALSNTELQTLTS